MGIFDSVRRITLRQKPKATTSGSGASSTGKYSLSDLRKAFEKDELCQYCITLLAHYSTMKGFETQIKTLDGSDPKEYEGVKRTIDEMNRKINLDQILYIGQIKRYIYGFCGFEIVREDGIPTRLIPLRSESLQPVIEEDFTFSGFRYHDVTYDRDEVFYLTTEDLDYTGKGISKIQPIMHSLNVRYDIREDLRQASKRLWAPLTVFQIDTSAMAEDEEESYLRDFKDSIKPGQSIITNKQIDTEVINMTPDLSAFVNALNKIEEEIMGNFGIPKTLLAREKTVTKATLESALVALYEGPIKGIQRYLRREVEHQLYDPVVKELGLEDKVRVLHKWKPVHIYEYVKMADPVAKLVKSNVIDVPTAWEMLGLDLSHLRKVKKGAIQTNIVDWIEEESE